MTVSSLTIKGRKARLFLAPVPAPLIYVCLYQDDSQALLDACQKIGAPPFHLLALTGLSWNEDLSPWPEAKILSKDDEFAGRADSFLTDVLEGARPWALAQLSGQRPSFEGIAGYSMAGLFALYAAYRTAVFSRVVSASGALWYPGFADYAKAASFPRRPAAVYLSLGDRESRVRNPYFRSTEGISRDLSAFYQQQGIRSLFELNRGNHFQKNVPRLAKGIAWILQQ